MFSIFANMGPEIPLALVLMGLLALRAKVWPSASVLILATPEKVFKLIDLEHGKIEDWGRTVTQTELVDAQAGVFKKTYSTTLTTGIAKSFTALFSIRKRQEPELLVIQREGLAGRSLNNELLSQTYSLTPEGVGCRLSVVYEWGPRPMIAQLVARADLWGGVYRIKGLAETDRAVEWPYQLISAAVAVVTGAMSLLAFSVFMGWLWAALLTVSLFVHEMGHLLAYRLLGQPWGRMIFLPFLGALAIPRLPFETQGQSVFSALMGPGVSAFLALTCAGHVLLGGEVNETLIYLGMITVILNLFNLLPVEPLDGGIALRSVLSKYMGGKARYGLMTLGAIMAGVGFFYSQIVFVIFGIMAILFNIKQRSIDPGLTTLSRHQVVVAGLSYVGMVAGYFVLMIYFGYILSLRQVA